MEIRLNHETPMTTKTRKDDMGKTPIEHFKKWCNKERVGRVEEGTSQDMCPTNGDALFMFLWFSMAWLPILLFLLFII